MLVLNKLNIFYGKLHVIHDVSLQVGNEAVGLFGPNGAGKTTLIESIVGLLKPTSGEITFNGESLLRVETYKIIRNGIAVVPQERELFPFMSVRGNLEAGAAYVPSARERMEERMDYVFQLYPLLKERLNQPAGTLSGGEQRMLAIARALMADPKLLILDEPSSGLQPSLVTELFHKLKEIKEGISILVAEQNVRQSLRAVDRGYILENGSIVWDGDAEGLSCSEHVKKYYLGI